MFYIKKLGNAALKKTISMEYFLLSLMAVVVILKCYRTI